MLYIDDQLPHLQQAKKLHSQYITCYINRKLYGSTRNCADGTCKVCKSKTQKVKNISPYLISILRQIDIQKIVSAYPQTILKIHNQFQNLYKRGRKNISKSDLISLQKVFNYKWFDDKANDLYNAYDLCSNLKIETCVYCNRLYTSTVFTQKKEMVIRPTLDHWFSQENYPILALSFYNLIPSCSPCNSSIKHSKNFTLRQKIHPYVTKGVTHKYQLVSIFDKTLNTFKVSVKSADKKVKSTLAAMKIAEIYEHHQSELADLDLLKRKYNKSYLKSLGKLLDARLTEKEVYRFMFGVEYEDEKFYKRPLSKLKKDLLDLKLK